MSELTVVTLEKDTVCNKLGYVKRNKISFSKTNNLFQTTKEKN